MKLNSNRFKRIDGRAVRVSVNTKGIPWVVNRKGFMFLRIIRRGRKNYWKHIPGRASDIAVGKPGVVYHISFTTFIICILK